MTAKLRLRNAATALAVGALLVVSMPSAAQAKDAYPPGVTKLVCKAKAVDGGNKIKVNINPDQGTGFYKFQIEVKKNGAWFRYLKTYKTKGPKELKFVNLPKGTYRAHCIGKYGYLSKKSKSVKLSR